MSHSNPFSTQGSPNPVPIMNRASASPSISSLVDPPNHALASPSIATQSFFNQQARHRDDSHHSLPASPQSNRLPGPEIVSAPPPPPKVPASNGELPSTTLEASAPLTVPAPVTSKKGSGPASTATSSAVSPKVKPKDKDTSIYPAPPPLPGSGIMQGNNPEYRAPTVILTVPMNGEINKYVNFSRLAEERYGWDALHPRLAAQRERLARVAAAGAALERNGDSKDSGDDMSLDSDAEAENSNIEMGGMSDGRTGTDAGGKKVPKKRKLKEDEYDKDDGFVDDSDLLWEEQAAAANDGFFVYSGPLVPESEKPANDSRYVYISDCRIYHSTNLITEAMVHRNEAGEAGRGEVPNLDQARGALRLQNQVAMVCQLPALALVVDLSTESLASRKLIVHAWSKKRRSESVWEPHQCPCPQMGMVA